MLNPVLQSFLVQAENIKKGEKMLVTGPTTGAVYFNLDEPWVDQKQVDEVIKGQHFTCKVPERKSGRMTSFYVVRSVELDNVLK